jgi:predicted transcriptional regulator
MEKIINISTKDSKFYRQYLEVIKMISPINQLTNREIDVLSELLKMNNKLKGISDKNKTKIIFDYDSKMEMMSNLKDMSYYSFNNALTKLRKLGIIDKDNNISKSAMIYPDKVEQITFKFKIDEG